MPGITVFPSLEAAQAEGFSFLMHAGDTIIVQRAQGLLRALAVVDPAIKRG